MNEGRITLYKMDREPHFKEAGWNFAPHGRLAWLHRLLWWALTKMNALAQAYEETTEVIRLPLSGDDIVSRIFDAREGMFNVHRQPREILIGPATLAELIACPALEAWGHPFSFSGRAGYDRTLFDLPVHVEPQMEGVIIR